MAHALDVRQVGRCRWKVGGRTLTVERLNVDRQADHDRGPVPGRLPLFVCLVCSSHPTFVSVSRTPFAAAMMQKVRNINFGNRDSYAQANDLVES